jgi:hypothetical protein
LLNKITKLSAGVALAGLTVLGLSACSPATETKDADTAVIAEDETMTGGEQVVAPVTVTLADIEAASADGVAFDVAAGNVLYFSDIEGDALNEWTGTSSDDSVVSFVKGSPETADMAGTASVFQANKVGTAEVTMTNSATGQVIVFTVNVI